MGGRSWRDVDEIATAAVLQEQDADLRATLAQQRLIQRRSDHCARNTRSHCFSALFKQEWRVSPLKRNLRLFSELAIFLSRPVATS